MSNFDSQIEYTPVEKSNSTSESVQRTDVLKVGAGSNRFEVNLKEGLFLGANTFLDAPARIGFDGSALFSSVVITNDAGDIIIDEYGSKMIADAVITTAAIADGAVDTEKLAALAVEAAQLADSAVTTTKIANLAVGSAAIKALAVGTSHIANAAIVDAKIASLSASKITTGTLDSITITTDEIYDKTYNLPGVFVKTLKIAQDGVDYWYNIVADNGGLLAVFLNYTKYDGSELQYKILPGFNTGTLSSYYFIRISGGYYQIRLKKEDIGEDILDVEHFYITAIFNSNESATSF